MRFLKKTYFLSFLLCYSALSSSAIGVKHPESQNEVKFTANQSQLEQQVLYRAQLDGGLLFLESNCFTYNFYDTETLRKNHVRKEKTRPERTNNQIRSHAFRVRFLNALSTPAAIGKKVTSDYSNFYLGKDKSKWQVKFIVTRKFIIKTCMPASTCKC